MMRRIGVTKVPLELLSSVGDVGVDQKKVTELGGDHSAFAVVLLDSYAVGDIDRLDLRESPVYDGNDAH